MATLVLKIISDSTGAAKAVDQLGASVDRARTKSAEMRKETGLLSKAVSHVSTEVKDLAKTVAAGFGAAAAVRILSTASQVSREFGNEIAKVSTALTDTSSIDRYAASVRALAREYGLAASAQAASLYEIISAGQSAEQALLTLDAANKLAVGGLTSVEVAADGLTSVMNAYVGKVKSASQVSDVLFAGAAAGKTNIEQLSSSLGQVAPIAAAVGVSFDQLVGSVATLTLSGVTTNVAVTQMRAALNALIKPTKEASDLAAELGLEFSTSALRAKGLSGFLEDVREKTGGSERAIATLFGSVEAVGAVMALTGNQAGNFAKVLDQTAKSAGSTDAAYAKMAGTAEQAFKRARTAAQDVLIDVGDSLNSILVPAAKAFADNADLIAATLSVVVKVGAAYLALFVALPAVYTAATAASWNFVASLTAQNVGFLASIKNMGALRAAGGLLLAAFAGWEIGTQLRDQFLEVRLFGIAMVQGLMEAWERMKQGAAIVWEAIKYAAIGAFNIIKERVADMVLNLAGAVEAIDFTGLYESAIAGARSFAAGLKPAVSASDQFAQAVTKINTETDAEIAKIGQISSEMADYEIEAERAKEANARLADSAGDVNAEITNTPPALETSAEALRDYQTAAKNLSGILNAQARAMGDEYVGAALDFADVMTVIAEQEAELVRLGKLDAEMQSLLAQARQNATAQYQQHLADLRDTPSIQEDILANLDDEIEMLGLNNEQLQIAEIVRRAEQDAMRAKKPLSAAEIADLEAEVAARLSVINTLRQQRQASDDWNRTWAQAGGAASDAVADFAVSAITDFDNIGDHFKSLGKSLADIAKRTVSQLISEFLRMRVINPILNSVLGTALQTGGGGGGGGILGSLLGGGGGGGGGGMLQNIGGSIASGFSQFLLGSGQTTALGSMLGAANFGPGMATTWAPTTLGAVGLGAAGIGGALYGYQRSGNLGGAVGYGALGLGGAGALMGVASGAGAVAGGAGAFTALGSGLGLSGGALAAVPVVGWIIAAIAAVDMITGGKVFGTKYRPDKAVEELRIGMAGGSASQTLTEVRQRSLFRGRQWRDTTSAGSPEAQAAADALFDSVKASMTSAAQALAIDVPPVIDAAIRTVTEYDKKGKVKASQIFVDILGRSFKEADAESAATRIIAEGLIATVDAAAQAMAAEVPSLAKPITEVIAKVFDAGIDGFDGFEPGSRRGGGDAGGDTASTLSEVQQLAERWRDDAATLMEGAQFLLGAMQAMKADGGLLGLGHSLTETTDLVEELARGEETLSQTFARLMASTTMLRDAVDLMGVSMDTTGADFVKLAQDITDAAGGLEVAQALWTNYFNTFYSLQEQASNALDSILAQRASALEGIGLDGAITNDQFRAAFEAALPTLTPEQVVEWLQAGAAIRAASDAQTAYNDALMQAEQPMRDYEAAVRALAEEAMSGSLTDYQREIRAINAARDEEVARLNELARAAGMQAAAEEDLAAIHVIAARKAAEALAKLRQYGRDLVQEFNGGSALELLNAQIATIESSSSSMYQSQIDGLGAIDDAARSTYEAQVAAQSRIREFLDNLMLGPLGGLRPRDQLAEGQRQFDALMERALGGDTDAMAALPQLADQLLRIGQQVFASGDPYFSLRDSIMAALEQVAALPATAPIGAPIGGGGGAVQVDASSELQALYEERDRLLAEQTAAERLALAQDISAVIRDLIQATQEPLETIAADLNINIADLVAALGVNLDEMTAANANALGDIAASMGVNLAELAANVGVDLGALADRQSLLNDALEAQINELPADQRDELAPLLQAVEEAAALGDTAGVETGIDAMEAAINALAPSLRDQLAPYFEGVEPVNYTQLDALTFIDQHTASAAASLTTHTGLLERIANNLFESNVASGLPAYATGTTYVPRTGPALIHEGEMILPAPVARFLRQPQGGGASNAAVDALREELRSLREENAKLLQLVANKLGEVKTSVEQGATKQANATDRQTREIGARK